MIALAQGHKVTVNLSPMSVSLRVVGQVLWRLRYDLLAVLMVALAMAMFSGSALFASAAPAVPLLGVVVSIFIGFRNSSAYNRWWEARTLWGTVISNSRALSNALVSVEDGTPEMAAVEDRIRRRQVRHARQLAAELRGVPAGPAVRDLTPEDPADATAAGLLTLQATDIRDLKRASMIDPQARTLLVNILSVQATAEAGLERIRRQPIPRYYAVFIRMVAWLFAVMVCTRLGADGHTAAAGMAVSVAIMALFIVAERLGYLIGEPMENSALALPMDDFCAQIAADLLGEEQFGCRPAPPAPSTPEAHTVTHLLP